jgi:ribosomal protein S18 acetylase RimI-like enzyme
VLAVDPGAQGRGVARALVDAAESWARAQGSRRISLNVWVQNERARGLYEHLGYGPETMHYLKEL